METETITNIPAWIVALATFALLANAIIQGIMLERVSTHVVKLQARLNWLMGAVESHTNLMVMMGAKDRGIDMVWWDPTIERAPSHEHGEPVNLEKIRIGLPERDRKQPAD